MTDTTLVCRRAQLFEITQIKVSVKCKVLINLILLAVSLKKLATLLFKDPTETFSSKYRSDQVKVC